MFCIKLGIKNKESNEFKKLERKMWIYNFEFHNIIIEYALPILFKDRNLSTILKCQSGTCFYFYFGDRILTLFTSFRKRK